MNNEKLKKEIVALHPWHFKVDIRDDISTDHVNSVPMDERPFHAGTVSFLDAQKYMHRLYKCVYPEGLAGKSLLDCACNCGAYCFWGKELGAERTFGFDVREHWVNQANFLLKNRAADTSNMEFKVSDLYDVPKLNLPQFDFTFFRGIFYHLPDPVTGLKIAADLTKEVIYVDSATTSVYQEEAESGALVVCFEGTESYMSGVHRLNWYPTGPKVLIHILNWLGFPETKVIKWDQVHKLENDSGMLSEKKGRVGILAAREPGRLDSVHTGFPVVEV